VLPKHLDEKVARLHLKGRRRFVWLSDRQAATSVWTKPALQGQRLPLLMRADLFLVEHGFATTRSPRPNAMIGCGDAVARGKPNAPWKRVAKVTTRLPLGAELVVLDAAK
jgi:hypothetical protein